MYAVIKSGGKQYRVQPGDVLVVEKLDGEVGAEVAFDQVLMLGGADGAVTLGAPVVEGAVVRATLIETRRGQKVKIFKKIRRQGYRRTRGHRQSESVLRVTGLEGAGQSLTWDGTVDLTPRAELNARARGLALRTPADAVDVEPFFEPVQGATQDEAREIAEGSPSKARAKKAKSPETTALVEQPVGETPAVGAQTAVDPDAASETGSMAAAEAPKKPRAKKAKADDAAPEADDASDAGE